VILIADNWANMRDYEFINRIDRPVRIILCGTQFGINKQYLDLARATKGSVHTIEEDIANLMDLKDGEEITISGHTFIIKDGRFIELKKI
jgi:acetaldehyde dehydrogenase (acetylating)